MMHNGWTSMTLMKHIKSLVVPRLPLSIKKLLCHHSNFISLGSDNT